MNKTIATNVVLIASVVVAVTGCATVQPQQAVQSLDTSSPRYEMQDCRQARQIAMEYDDNVAGRVGVGLGLGLLLGPLGVPLAIAVDANQANKRNAVLEELKRHCEGEPTAEEQRLTTVAQVGVTSSSISDAQRRLQLLRELRDKGLLSEAEFEEQRKKLVEALLAEPTAPPRAASTVQPATSPTATTATTHTSDTVLQIGDRLVFRELDPISGARLHETTLDVTAIRGRSVEFNRGAVRIDERGRFAGTPAKPTVSGTLAPSMRPGSQWKAVVLLDIDVPPTPVDLRVRSTRDRQIAGRTFKAAQVAVSGYATVDHITVPGRGALPMGTPFDGEMWVDTETGIILAIHVTSRHSVYAFRRELIGIEQ
jgi:hypothetical protein